MIFQYPHFSLDISYDGLKANLILNGNNASTAIENAVKGSNVESFYRLVVSQNKNLKNYWQQNGFNPSTKDVMQRNPIIMSLDIKMKTKIWSHFSASKHR